MILWKIIYCDPLIRTASLRQLNEGSQNILIYRVNRNSSPAKPLLLSHPWLAAAAQRLYHLKCVKQNIITKALTDQQDHTLNRSGPILPCHKTPGPSCSKHG